MRVKLEIDDRKSVLDMIVQKDMTIGSLKDKMDMSPEAVDQVMVNGVRRSEYYSLNSGDWITFEIEGTTKGDSKQRELQSEMD
ncbi:hypothetical protein [Acetohalobium arabaticum]|uniref:hypothetical protein n=1 Tax=Acetohalobium arabaticum TaxID=28187 RepID=UPI000302B123|nr:hypothetical protein [Acetohalobium arabaticum]